jgi:hypothetical protein
MRDLRRWLTNQWDRSLATLLTVLGLVAILLGWLGVSDHVLPSEQIPYLASGGVLGLFLLGAAGTLWLSADMRDEWRKLDQVADELRITNEYLEASATSAWSAAADGPADSNGRGQPARSGNVASRPARRRSTAGKTG